MCVTYDAFSCNSRNVTSERLMLLGAVHQVEILYDREYYMYMKLYKLLCRYDNSECVSECEIRVCILIL